MTCYYLLHVGHTAVAEFYCLSVQQFVESVCLC